MFEGFEELKDMNKGQLINLLKDNVYPNRLRGHVKQETETNIVQRKTWKGEWYDYELTSYFAKEHRGTDMSEHQPIIGDTQYTWGELNKYPADLLRVMIYQYLRPKTVGEEE